MFRSGAVTHKRRTTSVLGILWTLAALQGCGEHMQTVRPKSLPTTVSISLSPAATSVQILLTHQFIAATQNDPQNKGVTWALTQSGGFCIPVCGTLSGNTGYQTTYSAPGGVPNPGTVTLTATSVLDKTKSASAIISVTAPALPVSVELSLTAVSVPVTQAQLFTVSVEDNSQDKGVKWSLTQAGIACAPACGTLASVTPNAATYDAPSSLPNQNVVTVTATSVADNTKSASAAITITSPSRAVAIKLCDDETENPNCTAVDNFSLDQIRDLFVWVNWQDVPAGAHTQELDFYLPQGHYLYVRYLDDFHIAGVPTGSALVMQVLPVAGTYITQRDLTGTWQLDVSLDGQLIASKLFQLYLPSQ